MSVLRHGWLAAELLRKAAADLGRTDMIYRFEQADAEVADIIRGAAIPGLIARGPRNGNYANGFEGTSK